MAANEHQPEDVVTIIAVVDAFGEGGRVIAMVGDRFVRWQGIEPALPAHTVDRDVLADHDEPRRGVSRRPVDGPRLQRTQTSLLERLFREIEITELSQQRCHGLRSGGRQETADPADVAHAGTFSGKKTPTGRIS